MAPNGNEMEQRNGNRERGRRSWNRELEREAYVEIIADRVDLLVGLLAEPIGSHFVQDLIHF